MACRVMANERHLLRVNGIQQMIDMTSGFGKHTLAQLFFRCAWARQRSLGETYWNS